VKQNKFVYRPSLTIAVLRFHPSVKPVRFKKPDKFTFYNSYGTHQLLAYADDVDLLGDNIDTIEKNTETLIDASKEVGLEINVEKLSTCCYFVTRMQVKIGT
jgi:hypothetical protein